MGVNKVEINGDVKLDLTQDTVTENTLLKGVTAHDAAGNPVEGKVVTTPVPKTSDLLKGDGAGGVSAAVPGTDYLTEAPVTSVNGATGEVKSTFYVTVTQGDDGSVTADKTAAEVYAAYAAGYAVYAAVNLSGYPYPAILPMAVGFTYSDQVLLVFVALMGSEFVAAQYNGSAWSIMHGNLASSDDIPTVPEYLPNPNALNIKIGNTTTSYDGSLTKTVEIPKGVTSVNGATGEVKSTFYVTVTQQGDSYTATADKTGEEVYAAYEAGYAVYAIVNLSNLSESLILPMTTALKASSQVILAFITLNEFSVVFVQCSGSAWFVATAALAYSEDIPTIPEYLPNPNALNIKIGNTTTSYDGSAAKTVEIPKGVPSVTTADNGKFLRVVNGAWVAAAIDNANGGSF